MLRPPLLVARSSALTLLVLGCICAVCTVVSFRRMRKPSWMRARAESGWKLRRRFTRRPHDDWVDREVRNLDVQYRWVVLPLFVAQSVVYLGGALLVGVFGFWT